LKTDLSILPLLACAAANTEDQGAEKKTTNR
jgi:hypothetical protein